MTTAPASSASPHPVTIIMFYIYIISRFWVSNQLLFHVVETRETRGLSSVVSVFCCV